MATIYLLHLSDVHFVDAHHPFYAHQERIWQALVVDAERQIGDAPCHMVVTGDLSMSGKRSELLLARTRLDELRAGVKCRGMHVVPGNHDADWSYDGTRVRDAVDTLRQHLADENEEGLDMVFQDAVNPSAPLYERFSGFWREFASGGGWNPNSVYAWSDEDAQLSFVGINTAWTSMEGHKVGILPDAYLRCATGAAGYPSSTALNVLLMHHPFPVLQGILVSPARRALLERFDVIMSGHSHDPYFASTQYANGRSALFISSASNVASPKKTNVAYREEMGYALLSITRSDNQLTGEYNRRVCQTGAKPVFVSHVPESCSFQRDRHGVYHIEFLEEETIPRQYTAVNWRHHKANEIAELAERNADIMLGELWACMLQMYRLSLIDEACDLAKRVDEKVRVRATMLEDLRKVVLTLFKLGVHKSYPRVFDLTPAAEEYEGLANTLLANPLYSRCLLSCALIGSGQYKETLQTLSNDNMGQGGERVVRSLAYYLRGYAYRKLELLDESLAEMDHARVLMTRSEQTSARWQLIVPVLSAQIDRGRGVIYRKKYFFAQRREPDVCGGIWYGSQAKNCFEASVACLAKSGDEGRFPLARADIHYSVGYFYFEEAGSQLRADHGSQCVDKGCADLIRAADEFSQAISLMHKSERDWDAPYARLAVCKAIYQKCCKAGPNKLDLGGEPARELYNRAITAGRGADASPESPLTRLLCRCGLAVESGSPKRVNAIGEEIKSIRDLAQPFGVATLRCHSFDIGLLKHVMQPAPDVDRALTEACDYLSGLIEAGKAG